MSDLLGTTDPLEGLRDGETDGWIVGGWLRDHLSNRTSTDYDVVVRGDVERASRAVARRAKGHPFALSESFGAWRVVDHAGRWQVDLMPLSGRSIEADLGQRDFTVNAIAQPLSGGDYVDPFGGRADLAAARLRAVSDRVFTDDPLRTMRLARLACELGLSPEPDTLTQARGAVEGLRAVSAERVFGELKRIICAARALEGLGLMDSLGITAVVLPELSALHGVQQSRFHHLDVYEHTQAVLAGVIALEDDPEGVLGAPGIAVAPVLAEPLADELTRGQALRIGALFHDVAKPQTRNVTGEGRVTFIGHDALGAEIAHTALGRLRASERLRDHVAALTRHHLRLGFLVHQAPLSRREIYRYLSTCAPVEVEVTLLSVADRLATRGDGAERAIARHLELAQGLLAEALAWRAHPPRPPVRGDEIARALGLAPGPEIGRLLAELQELSFAGEIDTPEQAIRRARELARGGPGRDRPVD